MLKTKSLFFGSFLIFIVSLIYLDGFFLKKNQNFCLHYILSPLSHRQDWDVPVALPEKIFDQKFLYLSQGSQSFVFESEDGEWVIKFYKFPSHMRMISWIKRPLAYQFKEKRKKIKAHNEERFSLTFSSYMLAYTEIPNETAISYIHLNPTTHLKKMITLVDKLGIHYEVCLDKMGFIVQKKAKMFFPLLQEAIQNNDVISGKKLIDDVLHLIASRCQKGIKDLDTMIQKNCGYFNGKAILIDVGRLRKDPAVKEPLGMYQEIKHVTQILREYLLQNSPELYAYYEKQLDHFFIKKK